MRERLRGKTLPIRAWFAIAAILAFVATVVVAVLVVGLMEEDDSQDFARRAAGRFQDEAGRWEDPEWRDTLAAELRDEGVHFVLFEDGAETYRSTASLSEPEARGLDNPPPWAAGSGPWVTQLVEIPDTQPRLTAFIYVAEEDASIPTALLIIVSILVVTAAAIGWAFGRLLIRPLRATGHAARQVAAGDLGVSLPRSRVTEVAEVNTAFDAMAAELRRSLEQQAELEQERRLFIAAIAHDLRTPLFSLRGYLEGLAVGVADTPEKQAHYLEVANEKAQALEQLVSDLFDYTRLGYLNQAPERHALNLAVFLRQATEDLRPEAEARGVTLRFEPAVHPCPVQADRHLLGRAVGNLLENALRYTPDGGQIEVRCGQEGDRSWFTIGDSGPGIPVEDMPHLFQPLYRGDSARSPATGGAGLGLTIAQRILLAHDGDLKAENRPGGGALFTGTIGTPSL